MKKLKFIWKVLKETVSSFLDDKCVKLSAALAYYTIFSLPPMLVIIITICSFFYGEKAIQGELYDIIRGYVGAEAAMQIEDVLANISITGNNLWATIIGIGMLLFGATGIFGEIQDSINFIWGLKAKPEKSWLTLIINRLVSFSMVLVIGFILLVSLTLNTLLDVLFERLEALFPDYIVKLVYYVDYVLIFTIIVLLFALIFKILPDAIIKWRHVLTGAVVTGVLFMIGKYVISLYLTDTYIISAYGGTGSLIVLLLWVYYSSIILYFGAEFTQSFARHRGVRIEPNRFAVRIHKEPKEKKEGNENKSMAA